MKTIQARDVEHAIEIANAMRETGEYDWFRGQLRDWKPASSLERRLVTGELNHATYKKRINAILNWMCKIPEIAYLAQPENVDQLFAVLQHYGIPTAYIDFTTEPGVAGFFASDTDTPPGEGNSVIYCLNTKELNQFQSSYNRGTERERQTVSVDVANLWRLKAQRGHFVFANHNWYTFFDMDRIVFPWSGPPAYPRREDIYPKHKSPLEHRLDELFLIERTRESNAFLRKMAEEGTLPFIIYNVDSRTPYMPECFTENLQRLDDWSEDSLAPWRNIEPQEFPVGFSFSRRLALRRSPGSPSLRSQMETAISAVLRQDRDARSKPIDWQVTLDDELANEESDAALRSVWNGMRHLPYTNKQVVSAMAVTTELVIDMLDVRYPSRDRHLENWFADAVKVDFGNGANIGSLGYCSGVSLMSALAASWRQKLVDPNEELTANDSLKLTHAPYLMFEFSKFVDLFAEQVIPSQIALKRDHFVFNPSELTAFGIP